MQLFLDSATVIAFVFLSSGIVIQMTKVYRRKSSADISITEVVFRTIASAILLAKMVATRDLVLSIGQSVFLALYIIYMFIAIRHHRATPESGLNALELDPDA